MMVVVVEESDDGHDCGSVESDDVEFSWEGVVVEETDNGSGSVEGADGSCSGRELCW